MQKQSEHESDFSTRLVSPCCRRRRVNLGADGASGLPRRAEITGVTRPVSMDNTTAMPVSANIVSFSMCGLARHE